MEPYPLNYETDWMCAHLINNDPIYEKWSSLGRENGILGYPTDDEATFTNKDEIQIYIAKFQNGIIYYIPEFSPFPNGIDVIEVTNHIYNEYRGEWFRWQHIFLGLPTTAPHSVGSSRWGSALAQGFEKGIIYDRGQDATTFTVRGDILGEYKRVNSYMSCLGFPTDNERDSRIQHFQGGNIVWSPDDRRYVTSCQP